jgi:phosphoglycolate phosphatase
MKLNKYSHIIWDWNGTLFNDVELCADVFNNLLYKYKINRISLDEYREIFTFPVKNYYEKAGLDFTINSFEKLGQEWMNEYEERKNSCSLFGDTIEVLDYIHKANIPQSILSAYPRQTLLEIVRIMKIESFFSFIYGLGHIYATGKIELGLQLIKEIGTEGKVLFIGDTVHDFEVSEKINADCILVANGHQAKYKLQQTNAVVIDQLKDIVHL